MIRLFPPTSAPRVFHEPLGVDFSDALIDGLLARLAAHPPHAIARVTLLVNTRRMEHRLRAQFTARGHGFQPRIGLVSDAASLVPATILPDAASPLHVQLQLAQLVARLLDSAPDLAPRSAAFDLAGSLRDLLAEMQEEQVPAPALESIETGTLSSHWERSLTFLRIVSGYLALDGDTPRVLTAEARQAMALDAVCATWAANPPQDPVIIAGSTGSRGPTLRLMQAVLGLPQGAVVLPGVDRDMPASVWAALAADGTQDHPQYRTHALCRTFGIAPADLAQWSGHTPAAPARTALVSLAMRPAPVTDQWRREGPELIPDLPRATEGITLLEARSPREEAGIIALRLRQAAQDGTRVALISPDRVLTRQVTAALRRWGIEPDDSAGSPLGLSAPGRLLRLMAFARGRPMTPETLLILLKHPLTHSTAQGRGNHLRWTRDLELEHLRPGCPFPDRAALDAWVTMRHNRGREVSEALVAWTGWLATLIEALNAPVPVAPLGDHLQQHLALTTGLCAGPAGIGAGTLWEREAGREALTTLTALQSDADAGGDMDGADYAAILSQVLQAGEVRDPVRPHPDIMIWGAMEARVQGAGLVILAGLNDGTWPDMPPPDPWMNRAMRKAAGLRVPDRRIGLAAHDFQQAVAGQTVWLTRSLRDSEAETVPSRWLNRLTSLLSGLGPDGVQALHDMRGRADGLRAQFDALDHPVAPLPAAPRPAPAPPLDTRPRKLSVTRIQTLIRDPYAIYCAYILNLRPLDPLRQSPDAPLRGTIVHDALQTFTEATRDGLPPDALTLLDRILGETLEAQAPWPAARRLWRAKLLRIAPWFLETEAQRRADATPTLLEERGAITLPEITFTLSAEADRIDATATGTVIIYDYKTGTVPSGKVQKFFDRQLPLEAMIVEGGGFASLGTRTVARMAYVGLGSTPKEQEAELTDETLDQTREKLIKLIRQYDTPDQGYASNRAMHSLSYASDYDHLARRGEWDDTALAVLIPVGQ